MYSIASIICIIFGILESAVYIVPTPLLLNSVGHMDKFSIFWNVHLIIVVGWYYKFLSTAIPAFLFFTEQRSLLWKLPFFFDQSFFGGKNIWLEMFCTTQLKNRIFFKDPCKRVFYYKYKKAFLKKPDQCRVVMIWNCPISEFVKKISQ